MRPPSHRPRKELHYLASSTRTFELPITVLSDGSVCVVIRPNFPVNAASTPGAPSASNSELPFMWVSRGNSVNIYQTTPTEFAYFSQLNTISTLASPDIVRAQIVITQNMLNLQGRVTMSYFEEAPNQTFMFQSDATGTVRINGSNIRISDSELIQNVGCSVQYELR